MAATQTEPEEPTLAEKNSAVWDMVLNLVHPAFLYVLAQLIILSHFSDAPALRDRHPTDPLMLLIHVLQFMGAWAVFYTALLRDMGLKSPEGTLLLLTAFASVGLQWIFFPEPATSSVSGVWIFLGIQGLLAGVLWTVIFRRWRRLKAATVEGGEDTP